MPHIHTGSGQHDMTVSAYIIRRRDDGEWLCLLHMHRKIGKLMQIGGHIELDETPWQTVEHEVRDESGYSLDELQVFQPTTGRVGGGMNVSHPVPFSVNTHLVGGLDNPHYHSDLCFGFVASDMPKSTVPDYESTDFRWLTLGEIKDAADAGEAIEDVYGIYEFLLAHWAHFFQIPANSYSLGKPKNVVVNYKQ